jgi:hypothetical protein
MGRFSQRSKRLDRQRESQTCHTIMPVAWIIGLAGLMGMGALMLDHRLHNRWEHEIFLVCAGATAVPFLLLLFRFVRGHFNAKLQDP